jgi:flagellar protein FliT
MTVVRAEADVDRLLGLYMTVERASRDMLGAALESDWDRVASIQERCGALIDEIRGMNARIVLSRDEQRAKLRIVRQIVQHEAQVRRLAYPWTERYEHLVFDPRRPAAAEDHGR